VGTLTISIRGRNVLVDAEVWNSPRTVVVGKARQIVTVVPSTMLWSILDVNATDYVVCYGSRPKSLLLHRLLVQCPVGMVCDHINGNGLDNRLENIRIVTVAQNNRNRRRSKNKLGVIGVTERYGRFFAKHTIAGKRYNLGSFSTLAEAIDVRDTFVKTHNAEFGYINGSIIEEVAQ
jgi:hypothetical protein